MARARDLPGASPRSLVLIRGPAGRSQESPFTSGAGFPACLSVTSCSVGKLSALQRPLGAPKSKRTHRFLPVVRAQWLRLRLAIWRPWGGDLEKWGGGLISLRSG